MALTTKKYTKKQLEARAAAVAAEKRILRACATANGTIKFTKPAEDDERVGEVNPGLAPLESPIPAQSRHLLLPNPCIRVFGAGPSSASCGKCAHGTPAQEDVQIPGSGRKGATMKTNHVIVCAFRGETYAPRSTWRLGTPACGKFEKMAEQEESVA